jgi:hypothetical protein
MTGTKGEGAVVVTGDEAISGGARGRPLPGLDISFFPSL